MRHVFRSGAGEQPALDLRVDKDGAWSGEGAGATDVIQKDLSQTAEPDGSPALRHSLGAIADGTPWQAARAVLIRQKLWVIQALSRACQLELKPDRRKGDNLVPSFVVVEIVVIVLQEKHGRGAKVRAINRYDLRTRSELQHRFVLVAEDYRRAVEAF